VALLCAFAVAVWAARLGVSRLEAAGLGLTNLGYFLAVAGLATGHFGVLGLMRRWQVFLAAALAWLTGTIRIWAYEEASVPAEQLFAGRSIACPAHLPTNVAKTTYEVAKTHYSRRCRCTIVGVCRLGKRGAVLGLAVTVDSDTGTVTVQAVDDLAVEELRRLLSALYRGAEAAASLRMLWDLSRARVPSSFDVRSVTSFIHRNRPKIPGRTAIVAAQDVAYGISRAAQVHLEDVPVDLQVFRKREDAVEWLAVRYPTANPPRENPGSR
jgi:hypothetical protein